MDTFPGIQLAYLSEQDLLVAIMEFLLASKKIDPGTYYSRYNW